MIRNAILWPLVAIACVTISGSQAAEPLKLLFLGDNGHHQPSARFAQLAPVLKERGIELTYSDKVEDLNAATLGKYDGLIVYANTTRISPEQEQALLDHVAGGKGFIPLHCASYCFLNSPKYIDLVGAQFQRHGTGTFRTVLAENDIRFCAASAGSKAGTKRTSIPGTTNKIAPFSNIARKVIARNLGPGSARTARAACSTPPGAMISGLGAIRAFKISSSVAFVGPSAPIQRLCRPLAWARTLVCQRLSQQLRQARRPPPR